MKLARRISPVQDDEDDDDDEPPIEDDSTERPKPPPPRTDLQNYRDYEMSPNGPLLSADSHYDDVIGFDEGYFILLQNKSSRCFVNSALR